MEETQIEFHWRGCSRWLEKIMSRVVLFPHPGQGHITPMFQLANILHHTMGFAISIVYTQHNGPDISRHPHFNFHLISDPVTANDSPNIPFRGNPIKRFNDHCARPFKLCLDGILSSDTVRCIVTDAMLYSTQAVADELNIPRIVLRTAGVHSFVLYAAVPLLHQTGYLTNMEARAEEVIPEFPPIKLKDIPLFGDNDTNGKVETFSNIFTETKKCSALIFNTFEELESPDLAKLRRQLDMPVFAIGPFNKRFSAAETSMLKEDRSSIDWLDTQALESVLYVSFGSIAAMDKTTFLEVAWGLANSGQPFLWVIRPGSINGAASAASEMLPGEWAEEVSGRSCVVEWAPQEKVLAHSAVGGFWTHSGWNSTMESICEGVPMMCAPYFADQMINARWVSEVLRIAINLERVFTRRDVEEGIRRLMTTAEGAEMQRRVAALKETAAACLGSGGSSYEALESLSMFIMELG
ncbi:UDP-glycosyltransferase 76B1-like [Andrographis paniculata]|uniref:UDP-glycosyltransferase 76B1-like n=1 Tax=Andrographis paniculata TaxID=175694 RepID=UPI0021E8A9ED|nr:UDP-glycosyltransferase 76B1-like [Andrographis paniculata]